MTAPIKDTWRDRMAWSSRTMESLVWPAIKIGLGCGKLVYTERSTDYGCHLLDIAGIDCLQIIPSTGFVRGWSMRVQREPNYRTFTLRETTNGKPAEVHKYRQAAALSSRGALAPYGIIQAYVTDDGEKLLSAAAVRLTSLIEYIEKGGAVMHRVNPADNNAFLVVDWDNLLTSGVELVEVGSVPEGE